MESDFYQREFKQLLVDWRRNFHMHPEISGEEKETSNYIASLLKTWGLEVEHHVAGYGVVGDRKSVV